MGLLSKKDEAITELLCRSNTWDRIEAMCIPEPNSGCYLWLGYLNSTGYAALMGPMLHGQKPQLIRVGRLVLANKLGRIPTKALHICDVRCCVNEDHLYEGTQSQNTQDAYNRNRYKALRV
jgi:hypothetical protein